MNTATGESSSLRSGEVIGRRILFRVGMTLVDWDTTESAEPELGRNHLNGWFSDALGEESFDVRE